MPDFLLVFGIIAIVLTVTALSSGLVERAPLSFPLIFLGLGFLLGEKGAGVLEIGVHDQVLEVVATLTLSLVLFLDALKLQVHELGKRWLVPALVLGPGTVIIIGLGALSLHFLLGFGWIVSFLGGAILASTDPVVMRDIVRDVRIPRSVRQVLTIEGGTNDIVVLPVILILIAVATQQGNGLVSWSAFLSKLLLLGPAIGIFIGVAGSWLVTVVDNRLGIRKEHQALYGIGLVLAAYAAATAAGGDGFLSAFFAGLAVVLSNQSLCDCFMEYGEITSEMAMLLAFVLFGAVLSGIWHMVDLPPALALAALVIFAIRPGVLGLVLSFGRMSWPARLFVSWFGPRGLNSLLLALLVVQAGVGGSELLLATVGVVVLASLLVHGGTATPMSAWYGRRAARETLAEERESTAPGLFSHDDKEVSRISPEELSRLLTEPDPPVVLDVRSRSSFDAIGYRIPGSIRVLPDEVSAWAAESPAGRLVVAYCA